MTSPRPYVVAAAAAVLAAVCFMPSASASPDHAPARATTTAPAPAAHHSTDTKSLADTGAVDTTPYLVGGAGFLVVGTGLLVEATRRSRAAAALPTP